MLMRGASCEATVLIPEFQGSSKLPKTFVKIITLN